MTIINTSDDLLRLLREDPAFYAEARRLILSDELLALPERFAVLAARLDGFIEEQRHTNQRLEDAVGELRGDAAYRICRGRVDEIAEELGFTVVEIITGLQLRELFRSNPPPDFTAGDRRSFYNADLIMRVLDPQGNPAHLAVEASHTADVRDTHRALRNAQYLSQITGLPAHAAIASRRNDQTIQGLLDHQTLLWYQLPEEAFRPQ